MDDTAFDPKRRLCPDGSCVGVMGPDGRCSVCGRGARGLTAVGAPADEPQDGPDASDAADHDDDARDASAADGTASFDSKRRLCDDGSCVGVVGPDGRCTVCGVQAA